MSSNSQNRLMSSSSRLINRFLNTNSSPGPTSEQSTLNVITSAAAAAVSSIHNIITSNQPVTHRSNCSSSSSSANSSAQNTPQLRDLTNQTLDHLVTQNSCITSSIKLEKKHFDKLNKLAEKLLKYCQSERMNLINSPPYIIDILPDICQLFNTIYFVYENKLHVLNDLDYFCVLIKNVVDKFQELLELFKVAGRKMYEENSDERNKLIKCTLSFSHILAEMKSIFPKDVYEGQNFRIAKKDASDFWKNNFGDRILVSWKEFEIKLNRVHKISSQHEVNALRETIQLTRTKYVSVFEFDIFTRLFQPWNNILNNWKFLVTEHPGYSAYSTYDQVHQRLQKHLNKPGSYLFRLSCTKLGQWAIGYVTEDHKILQTIPQSLIQALIDGQKQGMYIYPDGRDIKIDISSAIAVTSASRIQISKEQYDMYCDMGTSFQVCKICSENNKDRKLEPCGHLICSSCLENWQELQNVPSCPFCRCEIKTFEPIVISPFENKSENKFETPKKPDRLEDFISDDEILKTREKSKDRNRPKSSLITEDSKEDKFNLDLILSPGENAQSKLSEEMSDLSKGFKIPPAPSFPPPPPPIHSPSSQSRLNPPLLPPPPPPPGQTKPIVSAHLSSKSNSVIKIKIDNECQFEQFVLNHLGTERIKAACALILANNDPKIALNILNLSKGTS